MQDDNKVGDATWLEMMVGQLSMLAENEMRISFGYA